MRRVETLLVIKFLLLAAIISLFTSCALPRERSSLLVSDTELRTLEYAAEAARAYGAGRYIDSEFALRKALVLDPQNKKLRANLAQALAQNDQLPEAERILRELYSQAQRRDRRDIARALGNLSLKRGGVQGATLYRQALQEALKLGQFEEALEISHEASGVLFLFGEEREARCFANIAYNLSAGADLGRYLKLLNAIGRSDQVVNLTLVAAPVAATAAPQATASPISAPAMVVVEGTEFVRAQALFALKHPDAQMQAEQARLKPASEAGMANAMDLILWSLAQKVEDKEAKVESARHLQELSPPSQIFINPALIIALQELPLVPEPSPTSSE
jgi:hypothetical protein